MRTGGWRSTLSKKSTGLIHGTLYSVNAGSGIGTRGNFNGGGYQWNGQTHMHLCWAQMDQGLPATYTDAGWNAVLGGMTAFWSNGTQHIVCPDYATTLYGGAAYTGFGLVSGGPSQSNMYFQRGMGNATMFANGQRYTGGLVTSISGISPTAYTGEYWSYKFQSGGGVNNVIGYQKRIRRSFYFSSSLTGANDDCELVWVDTCGNITTPAPNKIQFVYGGSTTGNTNEYWVGPWASYNNASNVNTQGTIPVDITTWNRYEHVVNFTPGSGNYGTVSSRVNGNAATGTGYLSFKNSTVTPSLSAVPAIDPSVTIPVSTPWLAPYTSGAGSQVNSGMIWGSEADNIQEIGNLYLGTYPYFDNPYTLNFADIYGDFTSQRVEISDGTYSEPQCLVSWNTGNNGIIQYVFNKGQITSGINRILTVFGSPTTVGGNEVILYQTTVTVV